MAISNDKMVPMSLGQLLRMKLESQAATTKHFKLAIARCVPNSIRQRRGEDNSNRFNWMQGRFIRSRKRILDNGYSRCYHNDDYCLYTQVPAADGDQFEFLMTELGFKQLDLFHTELGLHDLHFLNEKVQITSYQKLASVMEKWLGNHKVDQVMIKLRNNFGHPYR